MKIHIVKKGDTLYLLAQKYNVTLEKVIAANPQLADPNQLSIGEKIKIPTDPVAMETQSSTMYQHKVKQGDTLWKLSKAWGVPLKLIIDANSHLKNPNALLVGETVNIPHFKNQADDPAENNKKNTAAKAEVEQPKPESPAKEELTKPNEELNKSNEELTKPNEELTKPNEELTQPKTENVENVENVPTPKEEMTQPKEIVNLPKLPELKLPEVNIAPVNPVPPQVQLIITQPAPPQPKPQLPVKMEMQPVAEKSCGCTNTKPMMNSPWPVQQSTFDNSSHLNTLPNSWYPGIGSPQSWGSASVNTSFAENVSPSAAPNKGYYHDCDHPWNWGPMQTAPINAYPTPYPAYSECCHPGYYMSHEACENSSYPVYPSYMHQDYSNQHYESAVQGSQWGHSWGAPQYSSHSGGYMPDYSQLQGQQSANSPYQPFVHGNTPAYPLEGYTTPYMFMPDYGGREGNVNLAPASPGAQENANNVTIASQNEVVSSTKSKEGNGRKDKIKDASTAREEKSKAKVSGKNGAAAKQKKRKSAAASRSSSYNTRSRRNPWIRD